MVVELVPMLVNKPMSTMIRRPMPRPIRMNRFRGGRTAGPASASGAGGDAASGGVTSVIPAGP